MSRNFKINTSKDLEAAERVAQKISRLKRTARAGAVIRVTIRPGSPARATLDRGGHREK